MTGRDWPAPLAAAVVAAIGLAVAWIRDHAVPALAATAADDAVASVAAASHATAARALWVSATVGAALFAAAAAARALGSVPAGQPHSAQDQRLAWALFAIAALVSFAAPAVPPLLVVAGTVVVAGLAARRSSAPEVARPATLAAALAGLGALAAAESTLFQHLTLGSVSDLRRVDLVAVVRVGTAGLAVLCVALAVALHGARGVAVAAFAASSVALAAISARAALGHGPSPELAAVHDAAPVFHGPIGRPRGGCLVPPGITVGHPHRTRGTVACPDPVGPGAFAADGVPLLAIGHDTPTAELLGWHRGGVGQVTVLVRIGGGAAAPRWRVGALRIEAWAAPGDPRTRPLPGSVLLSAGDHGATLYDGHGPGVPAPDGPGRAAQRALGDQVRADVLVHQALVPTAQDLVDLCAEAAPDPRRGVRCVLVGGDPLAWAALLRPPSPHAVDDGPTPELIYDEDVALPP